MTSMTTTAAATTQRALRWGFIGCGKISSDFANALKGVPDAVLHACAARSSSSAEAFASTHGFKRAYSSYEQLCADPEVDVVYIGTLHVSHFEHSLLALEQRKHVLVEKPMTMNTTQAAAVIRKAQDKKLFLMEGMWTRFFPAVRFVREQLQKHVIGDVHHVQADIGFRFAPDNARLWERALGGGGLLDIGIYPLAFVTMVLGGDPERVTASGKLSDGGVDVYGAVTLEYSGNRFASVQYSCLADFAETVTIVGSKGRLHIHTPSHHPTHVTTTTYLADGSTVEQLTVFPAPVAHPSATAFNYGGSEGFVYEAQAVTHAVQRGETQQHEYPLTESLALMKIMDAIRQQLGVRYEAD
ncbi:hypothetical protein P43SY_006638 [Pythium insidiosum]|uniref:D-xylose 1-dehydrogenase (NADP(+), D-xylono-1,5-lactone-forming) n=1 Tax=Pythium insidiosum TaxID=114742 RepID=A0AAD5Q571_PYTIN|nr:hypothetical protein P43SY_006638 [Pythium insidiosum]